MTKADPHPHRPSLRHRLPWRPDGAERRLSYWERQLRHGGVVGRVAQRHVGYWLRRLRHGCGVGYRDGRVLSNGVRLMDCDGPTETGWVCTPWWLCEACGQTCCCDYGYRGDPRAEAVTLASAWLHECEVSRPGPILAILGWQQPAVFSWARDRAGDGAHLVPMEADPSAPRIKVTR